MNAVRVSLAIVAMSVVAASSHANEASAKPPALKPAKSIYDQAFDAARKKATDGWMEDPLKFIQGDMSHCVDELAAFKTDKPVQQVQDKCVNRLDAVIKMLEKECNGGAGGGANPTRPLGRSILASGPGGQGEMHDPKAGEKQWANLPPKQREQILQSKTEGFPPGFEAVLQSYYERLAQEQVDEGSSPASPAAPQPSDAPVAPVPPAPAAAAPVPAAQGAK